jgi:predicted ATPase
MMIDELLERAVQDRSDAQALRRKARETVNEAERAHLFQDAADGFQRAITTLERGLRTVRRQQDGYTSDVCRVLEAISQTHGSLGGTWRDARNLAQAEEQYRKGNEYEGERRRNCAAKDTYNMLQLLIIRLLIEPARITQADFVADLNAVRAEIQRQVDDGRDDSWALADLALARFLCGDEADRAITDIEHRNASATFYESAYNAVAALVNEGLGQGDALGDRLESFRRLLQRKGGIR